jgi:hypothetical protein
VVQVDADAVVAEEERFAAAGTDFLGVESTLSGSGLSGRAQMTGISASTSGSCSSSPAGQFCDTTAFYIQKHILWVVR